MKTREILSIIPKGTVVKVKQVAIKQLGGGDDVLRFFDSVERALDSNQNYLEFNAVGLKQEAGIITVVCKASAEQELMIVRSWYDGVR